MALSNKQQAFVEAYLANGFNATKAARTAGYSARTARSIGAENLTKPDISTAIQQRMTAMIMTADEALARLSEHARGDLGDFEPVLLGQRELAKHPQSRLVKKIKRIVRYEELPGGFVETRVELELYDAQAALTTLLKEQHLKAGEPTDHTKISGLPALPDDQLDNILGGTDSPGD